MSTPAQPATAAFQEKLASGALAGNWTLDPSRSTVTLRSASIWGLAKVNGVFRSVTGSAAVSPTGEVTARLEVGAESVDTKNKQRDKHLRGADFFLVDQYPSITFTLDKLNATGTVDVEGTLTVRDTSKPYAFPVEVAQASDGELAIDATIEVDRRDFGLTWNQFGTSMNNTIVVHAQFTKA
jgi:polyisoprenoid-binding protein YceI